jgi:hypothetical protein
MHRSNALKDCCEADLRRTVHQRERFGGYNNERFKKFYNKKDRDSYKLNVIPEHLDA